MKAPRSGVDALAQALGVSPQRATELRRELGSGADFAEFDARLRAEASLADLTAAGSLDGDDIAGFASSEAPLDALSDEVASRSERELRARLAAHASWAKTDDRSARTQPAREAMMKRFEREVDPEGRLSTEERAIRAEHARKAYYLRLALKSAQARRRAKKRP